MNHDKVATIMITISIIIFVIAVIGAIAIFAIKAWLIVEGVKAIESMGGFAGVFEKIFQFFS
jgi:hypothetical protein